MIKKTILLITLTLNVAFGYELKNITESNGIELMSYTQAYIDLFIKHDHDNLDSFKISKALLLSTNIHALISMLELNTNMDIILPANIENSQIILIIDHYLRNNPTILHLNSVFIILKILNEKQYDLWQ